MKATTEEIVTTYQRVGSVWKTGRELGMAGQTVHERLRALGYPLVAENWSDDEIAELRMLVGQVTIGEIARRLGRPYHGVAQKISRLGIGTRHGNRVKVKVPRGAGYDKASIKRYLKEIDGTNDLVSRFARRNSLGVEVLCQSIERHFPAWWEAYRRSHSDLAEKPCKGCGLAFIPSNGKQEFHSRVCAERTRKDASYFGGKRSTTIGLAEGRCQLCGREVTKGLSSHHVLGKENDPENDWLLALCAGCHNIVSIVAGRSFVDDVAAWQDLITLAWFRKHGQDPGHGIYVTVEIELLSAEDVDAEDASERAATPS